MLAAMFAEQPAQQGVIARRCVGMRIGHAPYLADLHTEVESVRRQHTEPAALFRKFMQTIRAG